MEQFQNRSTPPSEEQAQQHSDTPRRMNRRAVILAIVLFLLVVAGMFVFAILQQDRGTNREPNATATTTDGRYDSITRIEGKHYYIDGVHTVVGEVAMPTPCDLLETSARVAESMPEQITIEFDVVNNAEFCAQVVTPQRFKVSASASPEATFSAMFEGRSIELNLIEAAPGETPEEFELYIKG